MDLVPTQTRITLVILGCALVFIPACAFAATLYLLPSTQQVSVGQTFTLSAYVSSPDQAMNAASGDISFPSNELQVLSITKINSVINLWIRDPSFTNSVAGGDVNFEGIVLNPGFQGTAGNLITMTFQAVGTGTAPITFSSGAVLANDGSGTNILSDIESGSVTIIPRKPVPVQAVSPASAANSAASASSSTTSTSTISSTISTAAPSAVVRYAPSSSKWKNILTLVTEWGLIALLTLLLLAAVVFLALNIVHRMRKWRIASEHDLLTLEETLLKDLRRIERELGVEKRGKTDPVRKAIEHVESDVKKDIETIDEIKKN